MGFFFSLKTRLFDNQPWVWARGGLKNTSGNRSFCLTDFSGLLRCHDVWSPSHRWSTCLFISYAHSSSAHPSNSSLPPPTPHWTYKRRCHLTLRFFQPSVFLAVLSLSRPQHSPSSSLAPRVSTPFTSSSRNLLEQTFLLWIPPSQLCIN